MIINEKYRVCISTGDSGTLPFMLIAEASLMLMVLSMMIITMKMMLLMMIMTNQNVSSPECHFKTINRVAPKNKWVSSFLSSRDRAR